MLTVWGRANSINVQKVMWALAEVDVAVERIDAGGAFGRLDDPDYVALNPNRRVPTLVDGDVVVWESHAIVRYIAARYGAGTLWPVDPAVRAAADQWTDWIGTDATPASRPAFIGLIRTAPADRNPAEIDASAAATHRAMALAEAWLADRRFVAGDPLTYGDMAMGAFVHRYLNLPIGRPATPNLDAYYRRLSDRPGYRDHVMLPLT